MINSFVCRSIVQTRYRLPSSWRLYSNAVSMEELRKRQDFPMSLERGKVKRDPLIKNLFMGKLDPKMMIYPEVLDDSKNDDIQTMYESVYKYFREQVDSSKIDQLETIPEEVLKDLREFGLFGLQVPTEYGGMGFTATEYARLCEAIGLDASITTTLSAHNSIGIKGLILYGTEEQKKKYLPKLASGEWMASFCLTEPSSGSDAASIESYAKFSPDKSHYVLNGTKIYITNGGWADFYTVFAQTDAFDKEGAPKKKISAFLVERSMPGVTCGKSEKKLGIRGSNTVQMFFDNVKIPKENLLGVHGEGFKVAMNILNTGRFGMGAAIAGGLRDALSLTTEYAINRVQFKRPLCEFELIQEKLARMAIDIYAMESMVYFTSALVDVVEDGDSSLEAACVKVFSSDCAQKIISECIQIHGGSGFLTSTPLERGFRDLRITPIFEGTNEILRLLIGLSSIQYVSNAMFDTIKIVRNPLTNPVGFTKILWQQYQHSRDKPTLDLRLKDYLHPSLEPLADLLEYHIKRANYAMVYAMQRYGRRIVEQQACVLMLADIAIDVYAMMCCLTRASRSYCTGLPNADHELELVAAFCYEADLRLRRNVAEVLKLELANNTLKLRNIAKTMCDNKGYCATHPLMRNL